MEDSATILPPPKETKPKEECRLWIGNLDSRLREYKLLKMVEQFGQLAEFDFLYHRSGPQAGQPRGYAFVTFKTPAAAQKAMQILDGKIIVGRKMAVKWAHGQDDIIYERNKNKPPPPVLSVGKSLNISKKAKIEVIEAKLRSLNQESLKLSLAPDMGAGSSKPTSVTYNIIEKKQLVQSSRESRTSTRHHHSSSHPYQRGRGNRKF